LNNKSLVGAMFICTAFICATLTYFLAGIVGSLQPNVDMMRKTWMYIQLEGYTSYWLIASIVLLAAAGIYLMTEKDRG